MRISPLLPLFVVSMMASSALAEKFTIDPSHSSTHFSITHLVIAKVKGRFDKFEGSFDFDEKTQKLDNVNVTIDAASINTNEKKRDEDLRSPNFFNVAKYPKITFKSLKTLYKDSKPHKLEGLLTIHGVTKPVILEIDYKGAITDPMGLRRIAFEAETKIDRTDFGITWNKAIEAGQFLVGHEVKIDIEGEAILATPKK